METRCGGFPFFRGGMVTGLRDATWQPAHGVALLLITLFVVLAYLPSFEVPFLFDDFHNIVLNSSVQPEVLGELFPLLAIDSPLDRPVALVSFGLNYLHAGLDARWYHAVNLAIHLINAFLLYFLVLVLARNPNSPAALQDKALVFALTVALVWAVHPVNTQAVTYIVQRMASLAALFYLAGLLVFVLWRGGRLQTRWAAPLFVVFYLAAFGSKPNAVTLPLAALLIDVAFFSGFRRIHAALLTGIAIAGVALAFMLAGSQIDMFLNAPPHRDFSGLERLLTQGRVICHYLTLLVWPAADRLQIDYDFPISRGLLDPPATILAIALLAAITAVAFVALRRARWPAFGWLFFLLALSIESSFILLEMVFEHRLYLPSTLLIAGLVAPAFSIRWSGIAWPRIRLLILLLASVLAWQTTVRNHQWQDLRSLWAADLERGASLYRAAINSGLASLRAGDAQRALEMFARIESADAADNPIKRAKVAQFIGEAHFQLGQFERSLEAFRRALEYTPGWNRPVFFAGLSLAHLGRKEDAQRVLGQLQEAGRDSVLSVVLEAELVQVAGEHERALAIVRERLNSPGPLKAVDRSFLYLHLGNMQRERGKLAAARASYKAAVEEDRENWAARAGLARLEARSAKDAEQEMDAMR